MIDSFYDFASVHIDNNFYYFGGRQNPSKPRMPARSKILSLDSTSLKWKLVGNLKNYRSGHSVIAVDKEIWIFGGKRNKVNEKCLLTNGKISCQNLQTSLANYILPIVLMVNDEYENC